MKSFALVTVGFLLLLGFAVSMPIHGKVDFGERDINGFNISFIKEDGTYAFNIAEKSEKRISENKGILNSQKNKLVFVKNLENQWVPDRRLYFEDLDSGIVENLILDQEFENRFSVSGWSPKEDYVILTEVSHYFGGMKLHFVSTDGAVKTIENVADKNIKWIGNNLVEYTIVDYMCESGDECVPILNIMQLNLNSNAVEKMKTKGRFEYEDRSQDLKLNAEVKTNKGKVLFVHNRTNDKKEIYLENTDTKELEFISYGSLN